MAEKKVDLDFVITEVRLTQGKTAQQTLNTFLFPEKRMVQSRVSSDYDYDSFREWVESIGIPKDAVLRTQGSVALDIKDQFTWEIAIMVLQSGDCETFAGPTPSLRIYRLNQVGDGGLAPVNTGKLSVEVPKTPTPTGRTADSSESDIYGATPLQDKGKGKEVPEADILIASIEDDSMIVSPSVPVSNDTPSEGTSTRVDRMTSLLRSRSDDDVDDDPETRDNADNDDGEDDDPDALLNSPAVDFVARTSISEDLWKEACEMFQCSPNIKVLEIPGLKLPVKDWQLLAVFKMLTQYEARGIPGAMLGDEMGLGKTAEALVVIVVHHYIQEANEEVTRQWTRTTRSTAAVRTAIARITTPSRAKPNHLPDDVQAPDAVCPTQAAVTKRWGIQCPCVKHGHTYKVARDTSRNPNIIIAPPGLIGNWIREFGKWVDTKSMSSPASGMTIYTSHKDMADKNSQNTITAKVLALTKAPVREPAYDSEGKPTFRVDEVIGGTKYIIVVSNHGVDALIKQYSDDTQNWVAPPPKSTPGTPVTSGARRGAPRVTAYGLGASWIIMDEVHKYKGSYKGATVNPTQAFRGVQRIASTNPPRRPPMLLAISGSIVETGPSCWQGFIRHAFDVTERRGRESRGASHLTQFSLPNLATIADLDKLQTDWEYIAKNRGDRDDRRTRGLGIRSFSQNALPMMLIARHQEDTFRGQPIGEFGNVDIQEIECPMVEGEARDSVKEISNDIRAWVRDNYSQEHEEWTRGGQQGPEPTLAETQQRVLRRYADDAGPKPTNAFEMVHRSTSYPYVAHLYLTSDLPTVSFRSGNVITQRSAYSATAIASYARRITTELKRPSHRQRDVLAILESCPFWEFRDPIRDNSPKLQQVMEYIAEIKDLKRRRARGGPSDKSHTRHMIVFTDTPLSAFLTFMILYSEYKDIDFFYLHAGTDAAERDRICENMQRNCSPDSNHKVLIGVYSVMADGHHLPRANYCIMMDMPISEAQQKQAAARIARHGQTMPTTIVQLYDPKNLLERLRRTRNQSRAILANATRTGDWFEWDDILS